MAVTVTFDPTNDKDLEFIRRLQPAPQTPAEPEEKPKKKRGRPPKKKPEEQKEEKPAPKKQEKTRTVEDLRSLVVSLVDQMGAGEAKKQFTQIAGVGRTSEVPEDQIDDIYKQVEALLEI